MLKTVGYGKQSEATAPIFPSKTATLVPEFAVEDVPSGELQPWFLRLFAAKDLPLGRNSADDIYIYIIPYASMDL